MLAAHCPQVRAINRTCGQGAAIILAFLLAQRRELNALLGLAWSSFAEAILAMCGILRRAGPW
jgi:hypothetical protein